MVFKNLEERLPEQEIENYLKIFGVFREPTKSTLGYLRDISSTLENQGLAEEHFVFGGYAILTHLVSVYGEGVIAAWRGSSDIDMAGSAGVVTALKSEYKVSSDRPSPNLRGKRTIKLSNETEGEVKIDFVDTNTEKKEEAKYQNMENYTVFGIPIRVASAIDLIMNKIDYTDERAHAQDIISMLGVLEHRKTHIEDICGSLSQKRKNELYELLTKYEAATEDARLSVGPSKEFAKELRGELRRYK